MKPQKGTNREDPEGTPTYSWRTRIKWAVIATFVYADQAAMTALGPSIPQLQRDLIDRATGCGKINYCDVLAAKYGGIQETVQSLITLLLAAPYGIVADAIGRKPLFLLGCVGPLLSLPCLIIFPSFIIPWYGMGTLTAFLPNTGQIVNLMLIDMTTPSRRLKLMSILQLASMTVGIVASIFGSILAEIVGSYATLILAIVLSIAQVAVMFFLLPETYVSPEEKAEMKRQQQTNKKQSGGGKRMSVTEKLVEARKNTVNNVGDVLFRARTMDADHRWEMKAFWLYLLSELPDEAADSMLPYMLHAIYQYTPAELGSLGTWGMVVDFFWMSLGITALRSLTPNEARLFQSLEVTAVCGDLLFLSGIFRWGPFPAEFATSANDLIPLTLKAMIANVTAEHRQGKVMGFLSAMDVLVDVIAPSFGGFIFAVGSWVNMPQVGWIIGLMILKPLAFMIASWYMIPDEMPRELKLRRLKTVSEEKAKQGHHLLMGL